MVKKCFNMQMCGEIVSKVRLEGLPGGSERNYLSLSTLPQSSFSPQRSTNDVLSFVRFVPFCG